MALLLSTLLFHGLVSPTTTKLLPGHWKPPNVPQTQPVEQFLRLHEQIAR